MENNRKDTHKADVSEMSELETEASLKEFMRELDNYLHWYNEDRIKESLGYMSPRVSGNTWDRRLGSPRKCPHPHFIK